jgi:hypothetical protein
MSETGLYHSGVYVTRHPEVLGAQRRASKGDGLCARAASFEGRFAAASG